MKYNSMKDVAVDIEEIAEESGQSYDRLASIVERNVKRYGNSYEEAVERVRKLFPPMDIVGIRSRTGLSQSKFAHKYRIPVRTLQGWEAGKNVPDYVLKLLARCVREDEESE